jgi:hypothetical protein
VLNTLAVASPFEMKDRRPVNVFFIKCPPNQGFNGVPFSPSVQGYAGRTVAVVREVYSEGKSSLSLGVSSTRSD